LDCAERLLTRDGTPVDLAPKIFDTLLAFVERPGRLLGKAELMKVLWPDTFVAESALTKNISDLRKILESDDGADLIETVPKSGYRFVAPVEFVASPQNQQTPLAVRKRPWHLIIAAALTLAAAGTGLILLPRVRTLATGTPRIQSLAVLPFLPMTAQNRDQYLELSMADSLIARLSATGQVTVRPISSVREFLELPPDPVEAGRRLHVDAVLDGTLQKMDGSLRVTVRLLQVRDGALLWSESLDDAFGHLFQIQDSLARQVASALSLKQTAALMKRDTIDIGAYEAYQKGRFFAGKRTAEGFAKAIDYYKDAIARDGKYALAWSGLADAYMLSAGYFAAAVNPAHQLAREAAARAIALDPQSPEAHTSMALVHENGDWDFSETNREYRRAIELNPGYATAQDWYGEFLVYMGHEAEGLAHLRQAEQTDPLSPNVGGDVAFALLNARRYDEAISEAKKVIELHPDFLRAHRALHIAYFWNRMWIPESEEQDRLSAYDSHDDAEAARALFFSASGHPERVAGFVARYGKDPGHRSGPASREFMTCMFVLQSPATALEVLETGYAMHDPYLISIKIGREFDSLRRDARFQDLVRKMKFLE
jgi:serine/threonine-protein kinase